MCSNWFVETERARQLIEAMGPEWDQRIFDAMENAQDRGISEDDDAFWPAVLAEVMST
jgi:hypothetical protein